VTNVKKGVLWVLTSALAYSMFTVFAKKILEQIRPTDVLFWRFTIAAPIAWAVVLLRRRSGHGPRPMEVAWKPRFAMGLLFGLLAWLAFVGIDNLPGALYVVIIYTYPALVAIGARILGKPASRQIWVAIAITTLGIVLTVPEVLNSPGDSALFGMVITLGNATLYAGYILYSERIVNDTRGGAHAGDSFLAAAWGMTGSLVVATVLAIASGGVQAPRGVMGIGSMIGLATVSTVLAGTTFFLGVRRLGPAPAALVAASEPVMALTWLVIFLDESLVPVQVAGAILVIVGVVWSQRAPTKQAVTSG
jgi:drug/metabolite transporter (DMT)-like permease